MYDIDLVINNAESEITLHHCGKFNWCRKSEYPEENIDLPQVTDKVDHIIT
jgi:hypothetical protein